MELVDFEMSVILIRTGSDLVSSRISTNESLRSEHKTAHMNQRSTEPATAMDRSNTFSLNIFISNLKY